MIMFLLQTDTKFEHANYEADRHIVPLKSEIFVETNL